MLHKTARTLSSSLSLSISLFLIDLHVSGRHCHIKLHCRHPSSRRDHVPQSSIFFASLNQGGLLRQAPEWCQKGSWIPHLFSRLWTCAGAKFRQPFDWWWMTFSGIFGYYCYHLINVHSMGCISETGHFLGQPPPLSIIIINTGGSMKWGGAERSGVEHAMPLRHAIPKCMHIFHDDAHCRHPCDLIPPSLSPSLSLSLSGHGTSAGCPRWPRASGDSDYYMVRSSRAGEGVEGERGILQEAVEKCDSSEFILLTDWPHPQTKNWKLPTNISTLLTVNSCKV